MTVPTPGAPGASGTFDRLVAAVRAGSMSGDEAAAGLLDRLLQDGLRDEWGFDGVVMTDFVWGVRDPLGSRAAGQDLEMAFRQQRARALPQARRDGRLAPGLVDRAARRLLAAQVRHAARVGPPPGQDVVASPPTAAARACRSAVIVVGLTPADEAGDLTSDRYLSTA